MQLHAVVTQAPQASRHNGGNGPTSRQFYAGESQRLNHGPRIDSALAGIAPGQLRTIWLSSEQNVFRVYNATEATGTDDILDWTPFGAWHPPTRQAIVCGRRGTLKFISYSDLVGEWRQLAMPLPSARRVAGTVHFYGYLAQDPVSFTTYIGDSNDDVYAYNAATETYTALPVPPALNGGNGGSLSWCGDTGRLAQYSGDAQRWRSIQPGVDSTWTVHTSNVGHGMHAIVRYHPTHARHLMVGGTLTGQRASLITSNGVVTRVTDVPAGIRMSVGSWVIDHPGGCWLVKTMTEVSTNVFTTRLYAAWPNASLTDVTWQDLGVAPDDGLRLSTLIPGYSTDIALIVSTTGLHAYRLPLLGSDSIQPNITSSAAGPANGPFLVNVAEGSAAAFITLSSNESVSWGPVLGPDASLFQKVAESASSVQLRPVAPQQFEDLPHENPFEISITATDASGNARTVAISITFVDVLEPALAPTIGTAVAGNASVSIHFTPANNAGRPPITRFDATITGGITKQGSGSPIVFTAADGVVNGVAYSGFVTATNADGTSPPSAASNSVTPSVASPPPPPPPPAPPPPPPAPPPGFNFHTVPGCVFGAVAGSLVGLAREVGVSITTHVYNPATGALVVTLPATATDANGRLPRMTHASLVAGTTYRLVFVWPDGDSYSLNLPASS